MTENIKSKLSSATLSDVLDEMGYPMQMLPIEIKPNFPEATLFGKARILKLNKLKRKKDYKQVYRGLYFLEILSKGDVLVVAGGFKDQAFFGELMSNLAISKKIEGAIIDGCTRDKIETVRLRYPIFARNNFARDIKKRGIVTEVDSKFAKIGKVRINRGDYLFGDLDGIVVIPKKIKDQVLKRSIEARFIEEKVKKEIKNGSSISKILKEIGEF